MNLASDSDTQNRIFKCQVKPEYIERSRTRFWKKHKKSIQLYNKTNSDTDLSPIHEQTHAEIDLIHRNPASLKFIPKTVKFLENLFIMDVTPGQDPVKPVSLSRKMSKVGLLAAMKTFTKPHFQRKKKTKESGVKHQQSRSWDSGLCNVGVANGNGLSSPGAGLGTVGSYKRIYWPGRNKALFKYKNNGSNL